jgi:predicted lipoprotein with Yx(FWY)xxD motif
MRIPHVIAATAVGAIALAACGSGGSNSASNGGAYSAPRTTPTSVASARNTTSSTVRSGQSALGDVLVDANGMTLYGLTNDVNGMSSCVGACATAWPPLTVGTAALPAGLDAKVFSVTTRADGSHQLKAGKWPLYRYAGDSSPGDTNGQGTGGVWFVATPSGGLHRS